MADICTVGSQITVNGYVFPGDSLVSAKYSIDGGEAQTRSAASNTGSQVYLSTDLFASNPLPLTQHTIQVEVDSTSSSRNYSIVYFLVDSSDQGVVASSSSTSSTTSRTSSSTFSSGVLTMASGPSTTSSESITSSAQSDGSSGTDSGGIISTVPSDTSVILETTHNGPIASATTFTSVSISQSSSAQSDSDSGNDGVPVGALIGGLLGGLGLLAIIALICFLFYRERRRRRTGSAIADGGQYSRGKISKPSLN